MHISTNRIYGGGLMVPQFAILFMPAGPLASQSQLERAFRSIRRMDSSRFENLFEDAFTIIATYKENTPAELAIGLCVKDDKIESVGKAVVNKRDEHGELMRAYTHEGTDFALHLQIQPSLETFDQLRALLLFELANAIDKEQNTLTISW